MNPKLLKKLIPILVLTLLSISISLALHYTKLLDFFEMKFFDVRMQAKYNENEKPNSDIIILLVDEASLQSMKNLVGRWPWPRRLYKDLLEFLAMTGAKAALFDIMFTEPQTARTAEGELGEDDMALIESTMGSGLAFHAANFVQDEEDQQNKSQLNRPLPEDFIELFALKAFEPGSNSKIPKYNNFYLPLPELYQSSVGVGIVEFSADFDGVYRRTPLVREYGG